MSPNQFLNLNTNCLISKGYSRSLVINFIQDKHWFIPNEWAYALTLKKGLNINKLTEYLPSFSEQDIESFMQFLLREHIALKEVKLVEKTSIPAPLVEIAKTIVETISLEINPKSPKIKLETLTELGVKKIVFNCRTLISLKKHIEHYKNASIQEIEIVIPYKNGAKLNVEGLSKLDERIKLIKIEGAIFSDIRWENNICLMFLNASENSHKLYFSPDIYKASKQANIYFNKRIHITANGKLKNAINTNKIFGDIQKTTLKKLIQNSDIKRLWFAKKNEIDICKDCEYKWICLDKRPLIRRGNNTWYSTEECTYNPYIFRNSTDQLYLSLEECGISSTRRGFSVEVNLFIAVLERFSKVPFQERTVRNIIEKKTALKKN